VNLETSMKARPRALLISLVLMLCGCLSIAVDYWEEGEITNVTITINKMHHWSDDVPAHP